MGTKTNKYGGYLPPSDPQNAVAVRTRVSGDREAAGALLLDVLKFIVPGFVQSGKFQSLPQIRKTIEYPTGEVVHLSSVFGTVMVDVYSPGVAAIPAVEQREEVREREEARPWEPWDGSTDAMCLNHTWRVGMVATDLLRHDWAYCDGSFTLDPPVYDFPPGPPYTRCGEVTVTNLYWLDLSGGALKSSMRKTEAGNYNTSDCATYSSSYVEWKALLDTVGPTLHEGKRGLIFDIVTEFEGAQEDEAYPLYSFIAVELTDNVFPDPNFVRLYFKADPLYLASIGQSDKFVGDGIVNIKFSDWGLTGDLAEILILNYNTMLWEVGNYDRLSKYICNSIDFF